MAVRYSTGLRDKLNGLKATVKGAIIGAGIALVDGGEGVADTITDSGDGFVAAGFAPGDVLFVKGSTTGANDVSLTGVVITSVAIGTLTLPTASVNTAQAFPVGGVIAVAKGGSLKDIMKDGKLMIYTGSTFDPDDGPGTRTLLLTVTVDAGTFVAGAFGNGGEFEDDPTDGLIEKSASVTWKGVAAASGSACTSKALKASHVLTAMGFPPEIAQGSLVFSLGRNSTEEDIDYVLDVMPPVFDRLRQMSPLYAKFIKEQKGGK